MGIRPEHISITSEQSEWKGVVKMAESLGSDTFYMFKIVKLLKRSRFEQTERKVLIEAKKYFYNLKKKVCIYSMKKENVSSAF